MQQTMRNTEGSIRDLGDINAQIMVFGGPYSNFSATKAIQEEADKRGIRADHVICTGDLVAYCAEPVETCRLIQNWEIQVVMGNCEESLGFDDPDCGCGFIEGSVCSVLSVTWYDFAQRRVSAEDRQWMRELPRAIRFEMNNRQFEVVHGGIEDISQFIFASTDSEKIANQIKQQQCDVIIGGHCGLPFAHSTEQGHWLNAGVIGMPANDGTTDGWYLLLTPVNHTIRASWHRLPIDQTISSKLTRDSGMIEYADAMLSGLWANMDVLPESERAQRGIPLNPAAVLLS
ncbi:MAG: putative phosphodiesterase [Gammaproteobacteria bacterium]|jgi:predicted phosphodiesterase